MANRVELNEDFLEDVSGGDLVWKKDGTMSSNEYDSGTLYFDINNWQAIRTHMYTNCQGYSDEQCINSLLEAKLISR